MESPCLRAQQLPCCPQLWGLELARQVRGEFAVLGAFAVSPSAPLAVYSTCHSYLPVSPALFVLSQLVFASHEHFFPPFQLLLPSRPRNPEERTNRQRYTHWTPSSPRGRERGGAAIGSATTWHSPRCDTGPNFKESQHPAEAE